MASPARLPLNLDRRSFIRNAALAGAGAVVASAASTALAAEPPAAEGPAPEGEGAPEGAPAGGPGGAPGGMGGATAGSMDKTPVDYVPAVGEYPVGVPAGTPEGLDWVAVPEPITDAAQEYEADVVVVGAGIAGLAAARAATEEGASVIVVEACDTWQTRGQDCGTINSSFQKANGLECSEEDINQVCLEMQKYTGNRANQQIMRTWAARSGADYDWWYKDLLEPAGFGIEIPRWPLEAGYDPVDGEWFPQFCNQQEFVVPEGVEAGFNGGFPLAIDLLAQASIDAGAQFFFNTRARQLVRGDDNNTGRVTAVIAEDADGNHVRFSAKKGVVLATGDYGHNDAMMRAWCPSQADLAATSNVYGTTANQGDGHLMGMWVGGIIQGLPHPHMAHGTPGNLGAFPALLVDINGRRFTNEDIPGQTFSNIAELLPRKVWWQIADAQYPNQLKWTQPGHGANMEFSGDLDAWNAAIETGDKDTIEAMLTEQGAGAHAWTIEELAEAITVDPAVLQQTIDRYNGFCEAGYDADFGKQAKRLFPVSTPPYFYSTSSWSFLVSMGGLYTNAEAEVLDQFGNPIPGLYAAGNVQGGRFAVDYPTIVCGISHSMCLTYGRIAGTNAATCDETVEENPSLYKEAQLAAAAETAAAAEAQAASANYTDGTYEASGTGIGGAVPVTVVVEGGRIASVEVGENGETQGIGSKAIEQLPAAIAEANGTTGVDAVSGATVTSSAIFSAVEECLAQAGA